MGKPLIFVEKVSVGMLKVVYVTQWYFVTCNRIQIQETTMKKRGLQSRREYNQAKPVAVV